MPGVVLSILLLAACGGDAGQVGLGEVTSGDGGAPDGGARDGGVVVRSCQGCGANQVCVEGQCTDVPASCPCPKETYCDLSAQSCKIGCTADGDCSSGRICDQRMCHAGCRADTDCPSDQYCGSGQTCQIGCRSDTDCPSSADVCSKHACSNNCGTCNDGDPCTSDVCKRSVCTHPPASDGIACADDGNECTLDACQAGVCKHSATNEGMSCPNPSGSAICQTNNRCSAGKCISDAAPDGTSCGAGSFDLCHGGACGPVIAYCHNDTHGFSYLDSTNHFGGGDVAGSCFCRTSSELNANDFDGFGVLDSNDRPVQCSVCKAGAVPLVSFLCW